MATLEDIEKRRADRLAAKNKARAEQELADLEAIDKLEAAGDEVLRTMTANDFKPGVPYRIAFRSPSPEVYKRYADQVGNALQKGDAGARKKAQELLAQSCIAYPEKGSDAYKALLAGFPGVLLSMAIEVAKVAELEAEEEGKG
jgi:hypothetical protein